jgi:hypothetical protein
MTVIIRGEFVAERLLSVPSAEQSQGGSRCQGYRDVETAVTRCLITQDTDLFYQQSMQRSPNYMINVSFLVRTMWQRSRTAV